MRSSKENAFPRTYLASSIPKQEVEPPEHCPIMRASGQIRAFTETFLPESLVEMRDVGVQCRAGFTEMVDVEVVQPGQDLLNMSAHEAELSFAGLCQLTKSKTSSGRLSMWCASSIVARLGNMYS